MDTLAVINVLLVAVACLIALVLVVPFRVRAKGSFRDTALAGWGQLDWGWGLLAIQVGQGKGARLRLLGVPVLRLRGRTRPREPSQRRDGNALTRAVALMRHRGAVLTAIRRLVRTLNMHVTVSGLVGTGDPADNALLLMVLRGLQDLPGVDLALEIDWIDEALDLDAQASARIWVIHLLGVAALLLARRQNRMALRAVA